MSSNALAPSASTITLTAGPYGRSGSSISVTVCPIDFRISTDLRKFSRTADCAFSHVPFTRPMRASRLFAGRDITSLCTHDARPEGNTPGSGLTITPKTVLQSTALRAIGPILSSVHASAIAPWRLTAPYVGRRPVTPENAAGVTIDPEVSLPMANGTSPAATAAPGPLDEPPDQYSRFHGVRPGPVNDASALL